MNSSDMMDQDSEQNDYAVEDDDIVGDNPDEQGVNEIDEYDDMEYDSAGGNDVERDTPMSNADGTHSEYDRRQSSRNTVRRDYAADTAGSEYYSDLEDDIQKNQTNINSNSFASSVLAKAIEPLTKYFTERLLQVVYLLQGTEESMKGWKVYISSCERGILAGIIDITYVSNRGRKYRSRVEVACALGLMPTPKNTKSMSREQMYLHAMEMREKHLISQLLSASYGACDFVQYTNDIATFICGDKVIGNILDPAVRLDTANLNPDDMIFFSFGNITVLNWGNIIPDPAFHSPTQIFPVGFKCIRQEHDVTLDRIVECLCEIDSCQEYNPVTKTTTLLPLFRLSVSWTMNNGSRKVRVYEAKSPQQTWQAAMLETEGLDLDKNENNSVSIIRETSDQMKNVLIRSSSLDSMASSSASVDNSEQKQFESFEDMDDIEIALRAKVCDERRKYFRALRLEQKQGLQAAVVPRLALDNVETFADEGIMRLIEGMQGALDCENYTFVDSREPEGGRRNIWRGYGSTNDKLKNLYKVYKKSGFVSIQGYDSQGQNSQALKRKGSDGVVLLEDVDLRKKMRQDVRDQRIHSSSLQKTRNSYVKKLESTVGNIRNNIMKQMRKRREEMKYIIGGISDQEYQLSRNVHVENLGSTISNIRLHGNGIDNSHGSQTDSTGSFGYVPDQIALNEHLPLPEPTNGMILLDGSIFGDILEIWDYLQTFSDALDLDNAFNWTTEVSLAQPFLPDISKLCNAFKRYDPHFTRLLSLAPDIRNTFEYASGCFPTRNGKKIQAFDVTKEKADDIINLIGIALTRTLMGDFERIMGIDAAKESIGNNKIIINSLTWREIAKTALIVGCGREIGVSDADLASSLKGRGYFCTPETADKKALRLCRRRILYSYYIRNEVPESIIGHSSGIVARIPCPSFHSQVNEATASWLKLLAEVRYVPDTYGWLIHDILYAVMTICPFDEIKSNLSGCLKSSFDRISTSRVKNLAESVLNKFLSSHPRLSIVSGYATDVHPHQWPTVGWDLLRDQFKYQYLHAKADYLHLRNIADDEEIEEEVEKAEDSDDDILEDDEPSKALNESIAENTNDDDKNRSQTPMLNENPDKSSPNDATFKSTEDMIEDADKMPVYQGVGRPRSVPGRFSKATPNKLPSAISSALDYDKEDHDKLSISMQRCFSCLLEMMLHYLSQPFILPVDGRTVVGYYNFISQPVCFLDIKRHLLQGGYRDSISHFYSDVMILLENSVAFNPDTSPIHQSALRLVIIFERLFYEMVLTWDDSALLSSACCHGCRQHQHSSVSLSIEPTQSQDRSSSPVDDNIAAKTATCERCEATFHLGCLDPPVTTPLRTDWYCNGCIENQSISFVHPNKLTKVRHPSKSGINGQVVSIEQVRQTIIFIVEFNDKTREMWEGRKIREFAIVPESLEFGVPVLPSGYSYDDYDAVCGLARGYSGWGNFQSLIPAHLSDSHSFYARRRSLVDPFFHKSRLAIAWLGSSNLKPEDIGIKEITTIFRAIAQRALTTPALMSAIAKQDEINGEVLTSCAEKIANGNISYDNLIMKFQPIEKPDAVEKGKNKKSRIAEPVDNDEDSDADILDGMVMPGDENISGETFEVDDDKKDEEIIATTDNNQNHLDSEELEELNAEREAANELAVWEHRRLSRRRGREDALSSHFLLTEVMRTADIDGQQEIKEVGNIVTQVVGDFYSSAMPAIVKVCTAKAHEDLDVDEWCRGYQSKTSDLHSPTHNEHQICGFCGQDEYSVSSIFVWGQTWSEFMSDKLMDDGRKIIAENEQPAKRRGRYSKLQASRALLWKPCYEPDAMIEAQEGETVNRVFIEGSLPVHECCAEMMETCRQQLLQRSQRTESHRITDIIAGIGRGKTTSLGRDRDGNSYWVFCGLQGVFVCSESTGLDIPSAASTAARDMQLAMKSGMPATESDNQTNDFVDRLRYREKNIWEYYSADFKTFPNGDLPDSNKLEKSGVDERRTIWRLYLPDEDISKLIVRLDKRHLQERTLLQALSLLFPNAAKTVIGEDGANSEAKHSESEPTISEKIVEVSPLIASSKPQEISINPVASVTPTKPTEPIEKPKSESDFREGKYSKPSDEEAEMDFDDISNPKASSNNAEDSSDEDVIEFVTVEKKRVGRPPKSAFELRSPEHDSVFRFASKPHKSDTSNEIRKFNIGDRVVVEGSSKNGLLWIAEIVDTKIVNESSDETLPEIDNASDESDEDSPDSADIQKTTEKKYYYLSFDQWDESYNCWVPESNIKQLAVVGENNDSEEVSNEIASQRSEEIRQINQTRQLYAQREISQGTPLLRTLRAYVYHRAPHRESCDRPPLNFSKSSTSVESLRTALLLVERALPVGAIDDSDDRWGDNFAEAWREAVSQANDATSLMQAMVMLEYGIRTAWLIPSGLKLMSCLPSRIHALRNATIGLVALKLWTLDASVRYDKINYPKGHPNCVYNTTTASSNSKSKGSSSSSQSGPNSQSNSQGATSKTQKKR